jgi:hypothetical protein
MTPAVLVAAPRLPALAGHFLQPIDRQAVAAYGKVGRVDFRLPSNRLEPRFAVLGVQDTPHGLNPLRFMYSLVVATHAAAFAGACSKGFEALAVEFKAVGGFATTGTLDGLSGQRDIWLGFTVDCGSKSIDLMTVGGDVGRNRLRRRAMSRRGKVAVSIAERVDFFEKDTSLLGGGGIGPRESGVGGGLRVSDEDGDSASISTVVRREAQLL